MGDDTIEASVLGTKEYWDDRYQVELQNYDEHEDEGEVWFGRAAENRMLKYIDGANRKKENRVLDLGCGNGSLLRRLAAKGYTKLYGVDYSPAAIDLARKISKDEDVAIDFDVLDILNITKNYFHGQYNLVMDKGTWDAMSLCDVEEREARRVGYLKAVEDALADDGLLLIMSCNFTRVELETFFSSPLLKFYAELPAQATITFGGQEGTTSTGVVFKKFA
ncbi:unnamed protein product, partial [Mesorhabditis spiculigera]